MDRVDLNESYGLGVAGHPEGVKFMLDAQPLMASIPDFRACLEASEIESALPASKVARSPKASL